MTTSPENLCLALDGARSGPGLAPLSPAWLWVRHGVVEHLAGHPPPELPQNTMQRRGGWVIEPLADAHVHLFLDGSCDPATRTGTAALSLEAALERILAVLESCRSLGIAAVRDGGDPHGLALEAANLANSHPDRFAIVLPAGEPVFRRGMYGGFLGQGVETAEGAARLLDQNRRRGATHAKVLATGQNSLDIPGQVGPAQFNPGELRAITASARELNLPVMIHANGPLQSVLAVAPDSVEHGFGCRPANLQRMTNRRIPWVPTLGAWAELLHHPGLTPAQVRVVRETDRNHRREVRVGHALGVPIAAGSDAGTPGVVHGRGLLREIGRLAAAGLSPEAALAAATHTSRSLCQKESPRTLGGLLPGKPAGFVWLVQDPAAHPSTLEHPRGVFLGGAWSPRDRSGDEPGFPAPRSAAHRRGSSKLPAGYKTE